MADRLGTALVFVGVVALVVELYTVDWEPTGAVFGLAVVYPATILAISVGVATHVFDPETTREVLLTTGAVVLGFVALSVGVWIGSGSDGSLLSVLVLAVVPYVPMVIGFTAGALRNVPELPSARRRRIVAASAVLGLLVWFGSYQVFVLTHDTTGESGYHPGIMLAIWVGFLVGDLVVATVLYLLWRLFGSPNGGAADRGELGSKSGDMRR